MARMIGIGAKPDEKQDKKNEKLKAELSEAKTEVGRLTKENESLKAEIKKSEK